MIPEIAVCLFNLYHHPRPKRFIPRVLAFPADGETVLVFKQTAMIEHFGALSGGHYIARALRADQQVYMFNDAAPPTPSAFIATPNTYIIMYQFKGREMRQSEPANTAAETLAATPDTAASMDLPA
jgi:hypothetical protein